MRKEFSRSFAKNKIRERGNRQMKSIFKRIVSFFVAVVLVLGAIPADLMTETTVQAATKASGFPVFDGTNVPDIYVDKNDYSQIVRAVGDLQLDVERVTTKKPKVTNSTSGLSKNAIIVGSVDKSSIIKQLINDGKLDEAKKDNFANKWESFVIKIVDKPIEGVDQALVIAGSDKRGGVFGIYDVSEQIGVSPWYYWGDIEPKVQNSIYITQKLKEEGEPSVKYRGIFINDEQNLAQWAAKNDPKGKEGGNIGPETYKKVYELLLRLKSNYLWTAMHSEPRLGPTDHFNKYPENRQLASDYGVVVGTSHCEPMMRNGTAEWGEFLQEQGYLKGVNLAKAIGNSKVDDWFYNAKHGEKNVPRYDYSESDSQRKFINQYWEESVKKYKNYECSYTLGMRGVHDAGFRTAKASSTDAKTKLLQQIIDSQVSMMKNNKVNEEAITIFIPYKEVLPLYQNGLKLPDDTKIVWADDNHGFIRYFPTDNENKRKGGSGVYYHMNYVGRQTYIWLNSIPPSLVLSEMGKAYESGARDLWVLNVGDIKPTEIGIEFFLQMARDINKWNGDNVIDREEGFFNELSRKWFPDADPTEVSDLLTEYYRLNYSRKPEHSGSDKDMPFDLTNYGDEFMQRVADYQKIYQKSVDITNELYAKGDYQAEAFYLLVGYPAIASYYNNLKRFASKKSSFYKDQGRAATGNEWADMVDWAETKERAAADYYNQQAFNGKWDEIMDVYSVKYRGNQSPKPSKTKTDKVSSTQEMGVVVEGESKEGNNSTLNFSSYLTDTHYLDIFAKGSKNFDYTITSNKDWVKLSSTKGTVNKELRVLVDIDWQKLPANNQEAKLTIKGANKTKEVTVKVNNPSMKRTEIDGYAEANGYVAIEAEHYTEKKDKDGVGFNVINGLGRSGGSVTAGPMNKKDFVNKGKDAPYLSYKVYFQNKGEFTTTIYRLPTLDEAKGQKFAIGVDDENPTVLEGQAKAEQGSWEKNVTHGIQKLTTKLKINSTGYHTIKLYVVHTGVSIDRIIINTGGDKNTNLGPRESYHSKYNPDPSWTPAVLTPSSIKSDVELYTNIRAAKGIIDSNVKSGIEFYSEDAVKKLQETYTSVKEKVDGGTTPAERNELNNTITKAVNDAKNGFQIKTEADSNEDANKIEYAMDFNGSTRWAAAGSGYPRWYRIDLGKEYNLSDISISWFNSNSRAYKYKIFVSTDGTNYVEVVDRSKNTQVGTVQDSLHNKKARYIKLDITGSSNGGNASIYEISLNSSTDNEPVETEDNIALKKTVAATSEVSKDKKGLAANAVDGDVSTRWSAAEDAEFPQAVQVDLGAIYQVNKTKTYWATDDKEYTYNIYVTDTPAIVDGKIQSGLTPVAKGLKGKGTGAADESGTLATENVFEKAAKGRYVMVEVTGAGDDADAALWELQVYGDMTAFLAGSKIEAENGTVADGAEIVKAEDCSGGACVGKLGGEAQGKVSYTVFAERAGEYTLSVAYCTDKDCQLKVKVNDEETTIACPAASGWTKPAASPAKGTVKLEAGENTIVLSGVDTTDAPNVDSIQFLTDEDRLELEEAKEKLKDLVEQAEAVIQEGQKDYTEASWSVFEEAYNKAKDVADTADYEEVTALLEALTAAKAGLTTQDSNEGQNAVEKLQQAVAQAASYKEADYVPDTWANFAVAYNAASEALADTEEPLTEEKAQELLSNLTTAMAGLVKNSTEDLNPGGEGESTEQEEARKQALAALKTAIAEADQTYSAGSANYTETSWSAFEQAYTNAQNASEKASAAELNALENALRTTLAGLVKKQTTGGNGTGSSENTTGNGTTGGTNANGGTTSEVQLTDEEKEIAAAFGVTPEVAKEINQAAEQYKISKDTLYITEEYVKSVGDESDLEGSSFAALRAKAAKQTKSSIKLSWTKVKGADGYLVFGNKCAKGSAYKLLKNTKSTSYTQKKLKKGIAYKYVVVAYRNVSGAKVTLAASKTVFSITKGGKTGVAKAINVKPSKVTLSVGKTKKLIAKEVKADKKIKTYRKISYESSNPSVASVNKSGKITAKKKGKCSIYVYTQNGICKKVTVNVKR